MSNDHRRRHAPGAVTVPQKSSITADGTGTVPATLQRRSFLKTTAIGVTAATAVSAVTARRAVGANRKIRLALIGCGGRGSGVARDFANLADVEFVYVCDQDTSRAADAVR